MPDKHTTIGIFGLIGGFLLHLLVGSPYQWGTINVYLTSYFKVNEPELTLERNAIIFPVMMACTGVTIKFGITLTEKFGGFLTMSVTGLIMSALILCSSFMPNFAGFVMLYGVLFGLGCGIVFMPPIHECNKYFPGKRMYINGFILIGTGVGSVIFGQFSYNFVNPDHKPPHVGYYDADLLYIAEKVPTLLRYLALQYFLLVLLSSACLYPVCKYNALKDEEEKHKHVLAEQHTSHSHTGEDHTQPHSQQHHQDALPDSHDLAPVVIAQPVVHNPNDHQSHPHNDCPSMTVGLKSKLFWIMALIAFSASSGNFLINGNYKTYVKKSITDDNFLTIIGAVGGMANGCSRFLWNILFNKIGYRKTMFCIISIEILYLLAIRWTVTTKEVYLIMVFLSNSCLGGLFVTTPTYLQIAFGPDIGSKLYTFLFSCFSLGNFFQYAFVSTIATSWGFANITWIVFAMACIPMPFILFYNFQEEWPDAVVEAKELGQKSDAPLKMVNGPIESKER